MAVYAKYTHVERLGTEECEGLLDNDCVRARFLPSWTMQASSRGLQAMLRRQSF